MDIYKIRNGRTHINSLIRPPALSSLSSPSITVVALRLTLTSLSACLSYLSLFLFLFLFSMQRLCVYFFFLSLLFSIIFDLYPSLSLSLYISLCCVSERFLFPLLNISEKQVSLLISAYPKRGIYYSPNPNPKPTKHLKK